ncbi:polyhydroxyalkanoate synthesis repressor PhaR [Brevundimonas subvibrioides]|uniref:Polyhydroxyalkonate synthesis repressor, PhaR n=1 Tax=Brevundimonas subvibrioides (strain ATCC 15264 / DSM 4735 / LMG 14903 / NBRC 16000 / CB 81) TaxID=633149 RepID=D9QFM0_BRESC|nr:polyhydroxyalkanoate synthesis repressor PhaR [Brevundimonas subvibrioides]ADL02535.1 polyhydroxyalkonate synthesis repressor, PhaR [Brevundimonas subvibrioides ATCC 15264]
MADSSTPGKKAKDSGKAGDVVVIKKYANRRLYNTSTSAYVTLEDLATMVREGTDFVVFDAKTNEELTRQILTQIIFEEESRGQALLPVQFLRQLIGFYGGQMEGVLPSYLEMSLENFSRQQEQFRDQMTKAFGATPAGGLMGGSLMEAAVKQNMAMFENAMKMFPAFAYARPGGEAPAPSAPPEASSGNPLDEMRRQMDEMRAQIDRLASAPKGPEKP